MGWQSVRVRLTLWNVAVMALVQVGFGAALYLTVERSLQSSLDQNLRERARRVASWSYRTLARMEGRPHGPAGPPEGRPSPPPAGTSRPEARGAPPASGRGPEAGRSPGPRSDGRRSGRGQGPDRRGQGDSRRVAVLAPSGEALFPSSDDRPWDRAAFTRALAGQEPFSVVELDGEPGRVFSLPLVRDGEIIGVVQVTAPLAEQRRLSEGLARTFLTLFPIGLLVAAIGGLFLTDRALRPVRQVTQAAAQIGAEDLSRRLDVKGQDEFSELALTFNGMVGRLEDAFERLREAYEQQRRFTSDASHELRTPLTAVKANTSLALVGERTPAEYREALRAADQAADLMSRIVQDLLLLARSDAGQLAMERRPVPLDELLERAAALIRRDGAAVRLDLQDPGLALSGDPHHLTRLFVNLLDNAVRHTPPEGRVTVSACAMGESAVIQVSDTGEGIPPEHLPHVTERFYRVDAARARAHGGTGLGLAICRTIVEAHGGELSLASAPGKGTTVTVILPRAGTSPS